MDILVGIVRRYSYLMLVSAWRSLPVKSSIIVKNAFTLEALALSNVSNLAKDIMTLLYSSISSDRRADYTKINPKKCCFVLYT